MPMTVPLVILSFVVFASPGFAQTTTTTTSTTTLPCPGVQGFNKVWDKGVNPPAIVTLTFNHRLDKRLETKVVIVGGMVVKIGSASLRKKSFKRVIEDWNATLKNLCPGNVTPLELKFHGSGHEWGPDQNTVVCQDVVDPTKDVHNHNYLHLPDPPPHRSVNGTSTGHNHIGKLYGDGTNHVYQEGWIRGDSPNLPTDSADLLGEASGIFNGNKFREVDIAWFTHFNPHPDGMITVCDRIPWDHRESRAVAVHPDVPMADRYDFYSVMLHEVGHLLGLGHLQHVSETNNVMLPRGDLGVRRIISPIESSCLRKLYCGSPSGAFVDDLAE